jgi:hypothetical protein
VHPKRYRETYWGLSTSSTCGPITVTGVLNDILNVVVSTLWVSLCLLLVNYVIEGRIRKRQRRWTALLHQLSADTHFTQFRSSMRFSALHERNRWLGESLEEQREKLEAAWQEAEREELVSIQLDDCSCRGLATLNQGLASPRLSGRALLSRWPCRWHRGLTQGMRPGRWRVWPRRGPLPWCSGRRSGSPGSRWPGRVG